MKRCLLTLIAGLLCGVASAQAVFRLQYWFDKQHDNRITDTLPTGRWQTLIGTDQLSDGLHSLFLQVQDSTGQWFPPCSYLFYRTPDVEESEYMRYSYWFDNDFENVQRDSASTGTFLLNADLLNTGVHTITFRFDFHNYSTFKSYLFYKMPVPQSETDSVGYVFWFDQDYDNRLSGQVLNDHFLLDVNQLSVGVHTLNAKFGNEQSSTFKSYLFYKMPVPQSETDSVGYVFWFDQDYDNRLSGQVLNDHFLLDVDQLSVGVHTLNAKFGNEQSSTFKSYLFYKMPVPQSETDSVGYVFWFDQDYDNRLSGQVLNDHFLLDVNQLSVGVHTLNAKFGNEQSSTFKGYLFYKMPPVQGETDSVGYVFWFDQDYDNRLSGQVLNEHLVLDVDSLRSGIHILNAEFNSGNNTTIKSYLFYKKLHEEIMIVKYEYWLNDLDSTMYSVSITPQDTFDLVSLLQIPHLPIRSTCFQFNPSSGNPTINAKNDIHFKFYNGEGRYTLRTKPYVDIAVVDTVYADTIERNTTKTIAAPINNAIHWFKLGAGVGDSLSFRTDKLCTMQLYAPSGEMVFHAANDSVLSWNGCHSWEQGDYYLAVHDAADTGTISVSYQWIYRYAVLAWDVHRVGNGGVSTITFEGNGFSSLDTMFLVMGTDTIPTLYLERVSNTTMSVIFNFEGVDTGMYNGTFVYVDENLYKNDVVYVEEAKPIVLTTTCSYPSQFLRGSTVTYTYTITNTGNMTAYNVPIHAYISTSKRSVSRIVVKGLELPSIIDNLDMDSMPDSYKQELLLLSKEFDDDHNFEKICQVDSITGDTTLIRANYFFINIASYETRVIELQITATDSLEVWLSVPDSVPSFDINAFHTTPVIRSGFSNNNSNGWGCCIIEILECHVNALSVESSVLSLATAIIGLIPGLEEVEIATLPLSISSCILDMMMVKLNNLRATYCTTEMVDYHELLHGPKMATTLYNSIFDCTIGVLGALGVKVKDILKIFNSGGDLANVLFNGSDYVMGGGLSPFGTGLLVCARHAFQKHNNCPPCHGDNCGGGGTSTPRVSMDPNEITGYIAESGSHAVGAEQIQMPFMIEFENDTTFATANAHTVVVKDTLDGNVFDLNSFSATSFAIGEKEESVNAAQMFIKTVDMRPAINVLAQVQLDYKIDTSFAVATWTFSSLDPMTLLPTTDPTLGFLPANFNGDGVGEVNFTINRKANLPDSTLIRNQATIIFDNEDPIATSTWVNVIDNIPPTSAIDSVVFEGGTATLSMHATDNLSGVWRYNVYGQVAEDIWQPVAMQIPADTVAVFEILSDQYAAFRTTAIDSAGNVEPLAPAPTTPTVYDTLLVTSCESYVWFDSLYTASGEYVHTKVSTIPIIADSVTTLYLTINHGTHNAETVTACDNYEWHGETYSTSGTYTHEYTNADGCPSVDTLYLTIKNSTTGIEELTACESFTWIDGVTYTESTNEPTFTLTNAAGCDSIVTLHLTVNNGTHYSETVVECDSYEWNGEVYAESGMYMYEYTNADGCPSVDTLHLTINNSASFDEYLIISEEDLPYHYVNGQIDTTFDVGTPELLSLNYYLLTESGCDSVVTLHLTITVGLDDYETVDFKVFPSPTTGILNVQCTMNNVQLEGTEIQVVDMYGKLLDVVGANNHSPLRTAQIDLSRYANGVYFVKLMSEDKTIAVRKVVKQ